MGKISESAKLVLDSKLNEYKHDNGEQGEHTPGLLTGKTYHDYKARSVTILGIDGLYPDGERYLVTRGAGDTWSVETSMLVEAVQRECLEAAAPELLVACEESLSRLEELVKGFRITGDISPGTFGTIKTLQQTIAKAKGE